MKTSSFVVGDRVSNRRSIAEESKFYGVIEQVGVCYLVRWDRDNVRAIPKDIQTLTWEFGPDLILESRGKESPMRTFTQEEKDYILNILADPTHDSYVVEHIVKGAKAVAAGSRRANLSRAAELIVNTLGVRRGNYGLSSVHEFSIGRPGDEKHIEMHTSYGVYTITIREKV